MPADMRDSAIMMFLAYLSGSDSASSSRFRQDVDLHHSKDGISFVDK